ncbi:MAG: futalosine hydrolase [Desulfuromonadales bacterium]|nr:futalosine hydrolase [Desulfuromonadales bacterium]
MLLLIAATPLETRALRQQMQLEPASADQSYRGQTAAGLETRLLHTGIGPASTAISLTRALERARPAAVLMVGCGGSYPGSGLANGALALASEEIFGDLGTATPEGFLPLEKMAIPVTPPPVQRIPLHSELLQAASQLLTRAARNEGKQFRCGPFVTVSTCSGTPRLSDELERRTAGICESMEGAAAALACACYRVPFLELRGISNPTGSRDPRQWDIEGGSATAQWGLSRILDSWSMLESCLCNS